MNSVDGGWGEWSPFTECTVTCGGGVKSRNRVCNSPIPDPDGNPCDPVNASETQACNTQSCPSKR